MPEGKTAVRPFRYFPLCFIVRSGGRKYSFAGQEVSSTSEILTLRRDMQVGDLVPVRIWRNGEYLDLTMEMMAEAD